MAEIPVERKSSVPWWVWLIPALLLGSLIWWLVDQANEPDEMVAVAPPAVSEPAATGAGAEITDPLVIIALPVPDRPTLIGRTVRLTGVPVLDVIGDKAFWIGSGPDRRVLVTLREVPPPGSPTDADIDINPGQTINLVGEVRALPSLTGAERQAVDAEFGPDFAAAAQNEPIYIFARTAQVVSRP